VILAYLDKNEKNIDVEEQRQQIVRYAADKSLTIDMFVQDVDICSLNKSLETTNHTVIIANIVALGASLPKIKESLLLLAEKNLALFSVQEGFVWTLQDLKAICAGLDLIISIRSSLSSIVTKKALLERKSRGVKLGRKTPNKKRFFDGREEEIRQKLAQGITKTQIAKDLGVSLGYLFSILKLHPELKPKVKGDADA